MVSLWPFKAEDNSPASFERTLSTLSTKITQTTARLDLHRQHARRFKALWTLYTSFIYLLYSIILALVLGWENWGVKEFAGILGGPILIYAVRKGASLYFEYRINKTRLYLESLEKQRDETIEKLKVATKYNSTQQLLEKYGGDSPKQGRGKGEQKGKQEGGKRKASGPQQPPQGQQVQRTGLPPPPTANIRRPQQPPQPQSPQPQGHPSSPPPYPPQQQPNIPPPPPGFDDPGFAPNAFSTPPQSQQYIEHSRWYDRLLDVLLGEDETQPKNRVVLICTNCRLVNGQAPPGMKSLEELGRWRCGGCGAWNGVESPASKALGDIGVGMGSKGSRGSSGETGETGSVSDAGSVGAEHRSSSSGGDGTLTDDGVIISKDEDQEQEEEDGVESQSSSADAQEEDSEPASPPGPKTRSQRKRRG